MQFKRLRLSGFKSFVDPTELVIEPGLTGIVGPNGCGKSNLLEALRWVMGETSVKSLRGAGMEDVIFAGSGGRPQRNFADVTLLLDNTERTAPANFNDSDELQISRRIEREMGSAYRVNSKDVRQRDVQLIFADNATGAHSPALVSQGRVGAIIAAKPAERRAVLEEAAGISGLHSRRKEAEQRLRGAEANLERLADVTQTMDAQIVALKRQARQAERYKTMSADIRQAEAIVLYRRWREAANILAAAEADLKATDTDVTRWTQTVARLSTLQTEAAAALPALRNTEVDAAAALQRLTLAVEELAAEAVRVRERTEDLTRLIADIDRDRAREIELENDSTAALLRLAHERTDVEARLADVQAKLVRAREAVAESETLASDGEKHFDGLTQRNADAMARKRALDGQLETTRQRVERLKVDLERLAEERKRLELEASGSGLPLAEKSVADAEALLLQTSQNLKQTEAVRATAEYEREQVRSTAEAERASLRARLDHERENTRRDTEAERDALRHSVDTAREAARLSLDTVRATTQVELQSAQGQVISLKAELTALERLLADSASDAADGPALLDLIRVTPGYEAALATALADDLSAPVGGNGKRRWTILGAGDVTHYASDAGLPSNVPTLATFVKAPEALSRRLAQIGVVSAEDAARLKNTLAVGQRLVSKAGELWRWDGFYTAADVKSAAAERLAQRARHAVVADAHAQADSDHARVMAATTIAIEAAQAAYENATADAQAGHQKAQADATAKIEAAQHHAATAMQSLEASLVDKIETTQSRFQSAVTAEQALRTERNQHEGVADAARRALAAVLQEATKRDTRLQGLIDTENRILEESKARDAEIVQATELVNALPDIERLAVEIADQRRVVDNRRAALASARAELDGFERSVQADQQRLHAITTEIVSWSRRVDDGRQQSGLLAERAATTRADLEQVQSRPAAIEAERVALLSHLAAAETKRQAAADVLLEAEAALRIVDQEARATTEHLSLARETRARLEAVVENQSARRTEAAAAVNEQFGVPPIAVLGSLGLEDNDELPALAHIEPVLDKLKAERERLGAVNLLAEAEHSELTEKRAQIEVESAELVSAIAKLRSAIGSLNREGRQRLLAAFEEVNAHFKVLFSTLFVGGDAHLALIDSDDPLDAGLEIFAAPPGKKVAHMALLSGGEQALTATALIFAVFLTNPAPICVLDEVDAPLDDANVERFCDLLDDMIKRTKTRFLIVTHNSVTMSRMHRLYGVTMAERGVSQLVSVDLGRAEQLLAAE